jgi:glutathione S-transferase
LGQLPVLEVPGEGVFVQSTAIARWAAKRSDLYPTDPLDQLIVEELMESINEMSPPSDADDAARKIKRESFMADVLPRYMGLITSRVERSSGPFVLGKKISIADLFIFGIIGLIYVGFFDNIPTDTIEKQGIIPSSILCTQR